MRKLKVIGFNKREYSKIVNNMSDDELVIEFKNLPNEESDKVMKLKIGIVHTEALKRKNVR